MCCSQRGCWPQRWPCLAALAAALGAGCNADRVPWVRPLPSWLQQREHGHGDCDPVTLFLLIDVQLELPQISSCAS